MPLNYTRKGSIMNQDLKQHIRQKMEETESTGLFAFDEKKHKELMIQHRKGKQIRLILVVAGGIAWFVICQIYPDILSFLSPD
jgi:hypothetical protein